MLPLALPACRPVEEVPAPVEGPAAVEGLATSAGPLPTQVVLRVALDRPAPVAARCQADRDPEEVFFVEDPAAAARHTLRMSGLFADTAYTCEAVATSPGSTPARARYVAGPAPPELLPLTVVVDAELGQTGAWTLAPYAREPYGPAWIVIWGPDGTPRWWTALPPGVGRWVEARWHPEEDALVWGGGMDADGRVRIVDPWDGEVFAFAPPDWQETLFHHDGKRVADGRLLTLERRTVTRDDDTWEGFALRLVDPTTGAVDLAWTSEQALDAGELLPPAPGDEDPWHANWMDLAPSPDGPELYVSLCFAEALMAIDPSSGRTRWVLGAGRGWTLRDADGAPLGDEDLPQCQHGVEVVGDRTFLLYDNGTRRGRSSVAVWAVEPETRTATRTWTWSEPGWWEPYLGDVDDLGGGRVLVTIASDGGEAEIVEVDRTTGGVASRATLADGGYTYRAERYDGCALFDSVRACPTRAARHAALAPRFEPGWR